MGGACEAHGIVGEENTDVFQASPFPLLLYVDH